MEREAKVLAALNHPNIAAIYGVEEHALVIGLVKGQTLKGLYPGQPGRVAKRPSAELLLAAFKGINLTILLVAGQLVAHITALSALQRRLLELWDLPSDLYLRLTLHFSEPPPI